MLTGLALFFAFIAAPYDRGIALNGDYVSFESRVAAVKLTKPLAQKLLRAKNALRQSGAEPLPNFPFGPVKPVVPTALRTRSAQQEFLKIGLRPDTYVVSMWAVAISCGNYRAEKVLHSKNDVFCANNKRLVATILS